MNVRHSDREAQGLASRIARLADDLDYGAPSWSRALWLMAGGGHPDGPQLAAYLKQNARAGYSKEYGEEGVVLPGGLFDYVCERLAEGTPGGRPPLTVPERRNIVVVTEDLALYLKRVRSPRSPRVPTQWPLPLPEAADGYDIPSPCPWVRTGRGDYRIKAPKRTAEQIIGAATGRKASSVRDIVREWRRANRKAKAAFSETLAEARDHAGTFAEKHRAHVESLDPSDAGK